MKNDSLSDFALAYEEIPHSRRHLSKHYGSSGMANIRVIRAGLFKRNKDLK